MKTVADLGDVKDKKVLLRVDFDVPVSDKGQIEEPFRIKKQKAMLDWLLTHGAHVVMAGHISDESVGESFATLIPQLHILLGQEINFIKSVDAIGAYLEHYAGPALLDNVRKNEGEKKNDPQFAKQLATGFDLYINNDFAVCHRDHASVSAVTQYLPSYAGLIVQDEVKEFQTIIDSPKEGKLIIIGGAKTESKVPVIRHLLDKSEAILLGGVVANDILKEKGQDMGSSVVDEKTHGLLEGINVNDPHLVTPKDFIIFDNKILDIGDETMKAYMEYIQKAKMIIWNGPMGLFENPAFAKGTDEIAKAIVASSARTIVGGGDTICAIDKIGLMDKFTFVSTGGGAMLTFLSGEQLPALKALGYYG